MITHITDVAKFSFRISEFMMNFGFARPMRDMTAEIVIMMRHSIGSTFPSPAPIQSASIFTHTVQLPSNLTGIIKRMIPMTEGKMNPNNFPFFSIYNSFL